MRGNTLRALALGTVSVIGLMAGAMPLMAQDTATPPAAEDIEGEFLGDIELGASKRDIQTDTANAVTVINQEEIDDRQAGTVGELIDSVPGVTLVNGSTPQGSGINIRGFGANGTYGTDQKVLILVDGATTGAEELYRIGNQLFTDPQLYKEVTVNRGTIGSFEYGSGVVGGVVQLETKDASDFTGGEVGVRFRQVLEGTSNGSGFATSSTLAWQAREDIEFLVNYSLRRQSDQDDGNGDEIGNSAFRLPSYLVKGKYSFGNNDEHAVTASFNQSTSAERDVPYDSFGTTGGAFGNVDRDITTRVAGLKYEFNPVDLDTVNVSVNLTYSDQKIDSTYITGTCGFPGCDRRVSALLNADHRYETTKLTAKNTAYFTTGALDHDLRTGIEFIRRDRLDAASAPGGVDDRVALFVVDDMTTGGLTLSPALRYETQKLEGNGKYTDSYDNDALMGGMSARYEFASGFALFGGAAYTESLPIIDDLGTPLFMTQPERSHTFEAGASYASGDLFSQGDALRAKVNLYKTRLWDVTSYSRTDVISVEGAEIEASYAMESGLYFDFNANIVDGTGYDTNGGSQRWVNTPANSARLTVGKRFNETWDVSWEIVGNQGVTEGNGDRTAGFGVNNLRATYRPQGDVWQGAELRLGVENIFNQDYQPYLSTRPAPGRNFKITLAKTF
ncbi:MAG: TonB-dependent receptor plug domain-containing protein [Marinibacterium sp.]|nr:TonB-dependent receptor plug domain-containing protein [Marinibacterium sp.]